MKLFFNVDIFAYSFMKHFFFFVIKKLSEKKMYVVQYTQKNHS